ncbi:hypothetical protein ACI2KR_27345 [Pseudomonas luteola]
MANFGDGYLPSVLKATKTLSDGSLAVHYPHGWDEEEVGFAQQNGWAIELIEMNPEVFRCLKDDVIRAMAAYRFNCETSNELLAERIVAALRFSLMTHGDSAPATPG